MFAGPCFVYFVASLIKTKDTNTQKKIEIFAWTVFCDSRIIRAKSKTYRNAIKFGPEANKHFLITRFSFDIYFPAEIYRFPARLNRRTIFLVTGPRARTAFAVPQWRKLWRNVTGPTKDIRLTGNGRMQFEGGRRHAEEKRAPF